MLWISPVAYSLVSDRPLRTPVTAEKSQYGIILSCGFFDSRPFGDRISKPTHAVARRAPEGISRRAGPSKMIESRVSGPYVAPPDRPATVRVVVDARFAKCPPGASPYSFVESIRDDAERIGAMQAAKDSFEADDPWRFANVARCTTAVPEHGAQGDESAGAQQGDQGRLKAARRPNGNASNGEEGYGEINRG
jgi:hypothetical protein